MKLAEVHAAESGLLADMDLVAAALYGRATEPLPQREPAMAGVTS